MLEVGETIPDARVWTAPREDVGLRDLVSGRASLLFFYLFDFSAT